MALAKGCSDLCSAIEAISRTACCACPSAARIEVTSGVPRVSVPVLSKTTVSTELKSSRYNPPLIIAHSRADRPIPPRIARGVPAAIAQAPATMMTDMVEVPVEWLKQEWRKRGLLKRVQLSVSGCLGPCDVPNVVAIVTPTNTVWLGNIPTAGQYQ